MGPFDAARTTESQTKIIEEKTEKKKE